MPKITLKTKPDELCMQLTAMAMRLGPGAKLPPVRTLSRSFDVSTRTLHVALGRLETDNVISRRQGSGIFVSQQMRAASLQRTVALICNFNFLRSAGHSAFWDMLIEQAQGRAAQKNEACQLHLTNPAGQAEGALLESLMADLRAGQVQGVLGAGLDRPAAQWIIEQGVPLVTFASWSPWIVGFDQETLIRLGVQQLKQQSCRKIGLWKPIAPFVEVGSSLEFARHDEVIFRDELKKAGLSFDAAFLQHGVAQLATPGAAPNESHQEQGYRTALEVFGKPKESWPDGIVSTDDMMTHGALIALQELGVRAGIDVKIASHANRGSSVLMGREAELTFIEVDPSELVQAMFSMLETLMDGQTPAQSHLIIQPKVRAHRV